MPDVEVVEEKCMNSEKSFRGHTDLNHGPIGLQPIALPLSYIPTWWQSVQKRKAGSHDVMISESSSGKKIIWSCEIKSATIFWSACKRRWYNGQHSCLPSSWSGFDSRPTQCFKFYFLKSWREKVLSMPWPGFEPGLLRPQRRVLTTRRSRLRTAIGFLVMFGLAHSASREPGWACQGWIICKCQCVFVV